MEINTEYLYNTNNSFRNYVEKYIFKHHVTLEEALKHVMVREYANYLMEEKNAESSISGIESRVICGC